MQTLLSRWADELRCFHYFYDEEEGIYYIKYNQADYFYIRLLNNYNSEEDYDLDIYANPSTCDKPHWSC